MPTYEFICRECGRIELVEAETGEEALVPICHEMLMRRVWNPTFQLKGEGWTWKPNDEIPTEVLGPSKRRKKEVEDE